MVGSCLCELGSVKLDCRSGGWRVVAAAGRLNTLRLVSSVHLISAWAFRPLVCCGAASEAPQWLSVECWAVVESAVVLAVVPLSLVASAGHRLRSGTTSTRLSVLVPASKVAGSLGARIVRVAISLRHISRRCCNRLGRLHVRWCLLVVLGDVHGICRWLCEALGLLDCGVGY